MIKQLDMVGFWRSSRFDYFWPHPKEVVTTWDLIEKNNILSYLRHGAVCCSWMGYSPCRFSDGPKTEVMGYRDLTDGRWLWPEGLHIYVDSYNVDLPEEFRHYAKSKNYTIDKSMLISLQEMKNYNRSFVIWTEWCNARRSNRFYSYLSRRKLSKISSDG